MSTPLPIHYTELQRIYAGTIGRGINAVTVTSAEPGEGVSTIAYALARRAAAAGQKTLLVETNLFRPSLAERFGLETKAPWIPDPASAMAAMTEFPSIRLSLLPAPVGISSVELLRFTERRQMTELMAFFRERWDVIVFDACSLNRTNKGNIPAPAFCEVGASPILIVLAGRTASRQIQQAVATLGESGINLVGTVMNKRYDPSLYQELQREIRRFEDRWPRVAAWMRRKIERHREILG